MDTPIYKLFFYKPLPESHELAQPERDQIQARQAELAEKVGMRQLLLADMHWCSDQYELFGVELFPNSAAVQQYAREAREMGLLRFREGESFLGIPLDGTANQLTPPEPPCKDDEPVYRVYLSRLTAKGHTLTTNELNEINSMANEAARKEGGQVEVSAYCRWSNETWEYFGVERFPCMEAILRYSQYLSVSNWYSIWESRSILGTAVSGELFQPA